MPLEAAPEWPGSIWIGTLDLTSDVSDDLVLADAAGYSRARLLIRSGRNPRGFVELDVHHGRVPESELRDALAGLPEVDPPLAPGLDEPISVVLCTRDRPEALRAAIASLLQLNYTALEIVIVDNASATDASQQVVAAVSDPRVRLVSEPRPGLARARNRGVLEASHDIVAFTDDDVVVDPDWLLGLMDGFSVAPDVMCVCGIVPSGELRSFPQAYFDSRVTWARSCVPAVYRLASPPDGQVLFPFQVGQYGTGANFAMRRSAVLSLGGFDEALGVGSPTRGGEDIDMFVRGLLAGHALVYQPSALVWHRHRADMSALHEQISGYGLGLGAWIGKLLLDRRTAPMVLRRAGRGVLHARKMTRVAVESGEAPAGRGNGSLAATELWAAVRGPLAYLRARRGGARKSPLLGS
ncbi:MAG: Glycosyl transferase, family 2 [uncultured Propionibacteriaceae bacterium]|uniref:Glycosyl transferase, family 2 n=1 Tax=uncultured Propionibacteriaceae bacterium TaxID=257457 RepID=A0A6J4NP96_9ACTN|nr:MAG: Glycosyl transferase, family 2 [uncultured Propionibacteriaceae bacterium]